MTESTLQLNCRAGKGLDDLIKLKNKCVYIAHKNIVRGLFPSSQKLLVHLSTESLTCVPISFAKQSTLSLFLEGKLSNHYPCIDIC